MHEPPIEGTTMDTFLATLTAYLERSIQASAGPRLAMPLVGSVTGTDLAAVSVFVVIIVALNAVLALYLRRHVRAPAPGAAAYWQHRIVSALGRPLYILLWIYGLYVAATPILLRLKPEEGLAALRRAMDLGFDLGAFAALFWLRATHVLEARLVHWAAATPSRIDDLLVPLSGSALRVLVVVVGVSLGVPLLGLPAPYATVMTKLMSILLIVAVAVLLCRAVGILQSAVLTRFDMTVADNLRARKIYTQLHVISRVIYVTVGVLAVAAVLMLFQEVRHVGTSLLASAGIVGVIGGIAAQKTLANLFAGFQIALAQPVRQDDVVVVEGEWGRVEEITLTYIVVHIWDDRRLVLPLSYFIEKPFQNWTRTSAALMGSVFVWVDYSFSVEAGREALKGIIEGSPLWDRRYWNLQVSDATDKTMQLRVLATSSDSSKSWDLRCEIREKFIAFLQLHHPSALPRLRAEVLERAPSGYGRGPGGAAHDQDMQAP